jgi:hypothetical protein
VYITFRYDIDLKSGRDVIVAHVEDALYLANRGMCKCVYVDINIGILKRLASSDTQSPFRSVRTIVSLPLRRFPFIYIIHWSSLLPLSLRFLLEHLSEPFALCSSFEHIHIILTAYFILFKIDDCFRPFPSNYVTSNLLSLLDILANSLQKFIPTDTNFLLLFF